MYNCIFIVGILKIFFVVAISIFCFQDWTLQIKFVQMRDAGLYECQVSSHPPTSIFIDLKVVGKFYSIQFRYNSKISKITYTYII